MKSENGKSVVAVRGRGVRATPEQAREMCTCGHRASSHAALKYSCQAPGDHKGFCPCMRFLSAKEWRGRKAKGSEPILRPKIFQTPPSEPPPKRSKPSCLTDFPRKNKFALSKL